MIIAAVNNHYQLGGAETVARQVHEGALAAGHDARLHVTEGAGWPKARGLRPLYPRLLARLDHSRWRGGVERIASRRRWTDRAFLGLARGDAEVVHVHSYHGLYASLESFAEVARAKPLVWTFHRFWGITGGCDHPFGCERYQSGCGACPQVGRFAVGLVDRTAEEWARKKTLLAEAPLLVVSPSEHLARRVRGSVLGASWRVEVIANGVDPAGFSAARKGDASLRRELGLAEGKTVVLFTNRDFRDQIKGFPVVEAALGGREWPGVQVVLAGGHSGWARARLPAGLDVVDAGYVADRARLAALHEAADVFLYGSDGENFPCAVLEAMSAGCCVVATPVDGVTEQVEDGVSGVLAGGTDSGALARALGWALQAGEIRRRELGVEARRRVEARFTERAMVEAYLKLYEAWKQERTTR